MESTSRSSTPASPAISLSSHGLHPKGSVHWNLDSDELHKIAVENGEAEMTAHGVLLATTGERTGRSPNDRFIVDEPGYADHVWWGKVNRPTSRWVFENLLQKVQSHLDSSDRLYVKDAHCGADANYAMPVRLVTEKAWHAAFFHNMFVRSNPNELNDHEPEYTILHAPDLLADPEEDGVNSGVFVILALDRGLVIIGGTHYAGEIKKAIFTIMNHILPERGIMPMHCSANTDGEESALFFGLSGTGKTTLSADPHRALVGDDEHGWSDDGVFNFEGGCYAKLIGLSQEDEPEIYATTRMPGTILENVILDSKGIPDFDDGSLTQNTRASYPIEAIENRTEDSTAGHPKNVVFLTCDAFGVLPPLSKLSTAQAIYHFLSGFTSKAPGTETGVIQPEPTFSACFAAPFLPLKPEIYGNLLKEKISKVGSSCWLVNTGWTGGNYGSGSRIPIHVTRSVLTAVLEGTLEKAEFRQDENFGFLVPLEVSGVDSYFLNPRENWKSSADYDVQAKRLVKMFSENFVQFKDYVSSDILKICL